MEQSLQVQGRRSTDERFWFRAVNIFRNLRVSHQLRYRALSRGIVSMDRHIDDIPGEVFIKQALYIHDIQLHP